MAYKQLIIWRRGQASNVNFAQDGEHQSVDYNSVKQSESKKTTANPASTAHIPSDNERRIYSNICWLRYITVLNYSLHISLVARIVENMKRNALKKLFLKKGA